MSQYRDITNEEIAILEQRGCCAESWERVKVAHDFTVEQLRNVRLEGDVTIGSNSYISYSTICNYAIGNNCHIDSVLRMECRHASTFGNGVMVAAVNENGGRSIPIYNELTSQIAYIMAMMRNRTEAIDELQRKVANEAERLRSTLGCIEDDVKILGVKFIREVNIGQGSTIEGASHLENGTI
ncbi:MAG: DUF4954 family protein, partial [Alistipes sp.]|nr:DUF4954 family protein [Alistipes sp.]